MKNFRGNFSAIANGMRILPGQNASEVFGAPRAQDARGHGVYNTGIKQQGQALAGRQSLANKI